MFDLDSGELNSDSSFDTLPPNPMVLNDLTSKFLHAVWRDGRFASYDQDSKALVPQRQLNPIRFAGYLDRSKKVYFVSPNGRISLIGRSEFQRTANRFLATKLLADGTAIPTKNLAVTAHEDGMVNTWDLDTGKRRHSKKIHSEGVFEIATSHSGELVASIGADQKIVVSKLPPLEQVFEVSVGWGVRCLRFSPDDSLLAGAPGSKKEGGAQEGTVDLWDVKTGKQVRGLSGHMNWVTSVRFLKNGEQILTLALDGSARVWSTSSGESIGTFDFKDFAPASCVTISANEDCVYFGHGDGRLSAWNLDGFNLKMTTPMFCDGVAGIFASQDGERLVVATLASPNLFCLDSESFKLEAEFDVRLGNLRGLKPSLDNKQLMVLGQSRRIEILNLE